MYTNVDEHVEVVDTRDGRFRQILHDQLGENGVALMVNQAFIFILALILVISIVIGSLTSLRCSAAQSSVQLKQPAILI